MFISAEIRWFWPDAPPPALHDWFASIGIHGCALGGGADDPRPDVYLRDATRELGIKARGGKTVEVKGLVAVASDGLLAGPFAGPIEIWGKWSAAALTLNPARTIETRKRRWLRKFVTTGAIPREIPLNNKEQPTDENMALPAIGCNVELTHVSVASQAWWTFAFEAFGKLTTIQDDLRAVASVLAARHPPSMGAPIVASYPAWLQQWV
jgi:hypothetical protein